MHDLLSNHVLLTNVKEEITLSTFQLNILSINIVKHVKPFHIIRILHSSVYLSFPGMYICVYSTPEYLQVPLRQSTQ